MMMNHQTYIKPVSVQLFITSARKQDYDFLSQSCVSSTISNIKQATGRDLQAKRKNNQATSNRNKQLAWRTGTPYGCLPKVDIRYLYKRKFETSIGGLKCRLRLQEKLHL